MSGFELDKQRLSDKLPIGKEAAGANRAEANRALLDQLRQSSDIARDLASLYAERPYVYARVLKQLGTVLGKSRVKKLHNDVVAKAQALHQRAVNSKQALKKALKTKTEPSTGTTPGTTTEETSSKEIHLDVPLLGLDKKVELKSEGGSHTISCADWNMKFLDATSATVKMVGEDVTEIDVNATLKAKHLKNTSVDLKLIKEGSSFKPQFTVATEVEIPGLKGLSVTFSVTPESHEVQAGVSGNATVFEDKIDTSAEGQVTISDTTDFAITFTVQSAAKGGDGAGDGGAGGEQGAAQSALAFEGTISVNSKGNVLGGEGTMTVSGLGFLASPESSIALQVAYSEDKGFSAELLEAVTFAEFTVVAGGGAEGGAQDGGAQKGSGEQEGGVQLPTTVVLTVESASYSAEEELSTAMKASAKIGGFMTADASVKITQNQIEAGQFTVNVPEFGLPSKTPILSGNLTGTVDFDSAGFVQAGVEGPLSITIGGKTWPITLQSLTVDRAGLVTGTINLPETWKIGCVSFDTLSASFNTSGLQSVAGSMSIDHKLIKSEEGGITITGSGTQLTAKGVVTLLGEEAAEFGTVDFSTTMAPDLLEGTGTLTLSNDFKVGKSKLVICKDSSATLSFQNETFDPLKFQGSYKYNMPEGEGGEGAGGEIAASKEIRLTGDFTDCTMDMETGALSGSASADLAADITLKKGKNHVTLENSFRKAETKLNFAFVNSEVTTISGTVVAKAAVKLPNEVLSLEGKLNNFTYDVAGNSFSGLVKLGLNQDLDVTDDFRFYGNNRTNVDIDVAANEITNVGFNADGRIRLTGAFIKDNEGFLDVLCENGSINLDSSTFSAENVTLSAINREKGDLVFVAHNGDTELTVTDESHISTSITDNQIGSVVCDIGFTGSTKALNNKKDPIQFKGGVGFTIADIHNVSAGMEGTLNIETTADYTLDEIPDVDKITLRAGTAVGVSLDQESIQTITGTILLRYENSDKANKFFKGGYIVDLDGTGITYDVPAGTFSGTATLKPAEDIAISIGQTDAEGNSAHGATILADGTSLSAVVEANKLTTLNGSAGFTGSFSLGDSGHINIDKGDASLDVNVDTGNINTFSVTSDVSCDFNIGQVQVTTQDSPVKVSCEMDDQGLASASFQGGVHLKTDIGEYPVDLIVGSEGGMSYTRDEGINGTVSVTCQEETPLGDFEHNKNDTATTFVYGLGSAEGPAAAFHATFESNALVGVKGEAGFFLRQEPIVEDALQVSGNIAFDVSTRDAIVLNSAVGEVKIARKNLFTVVNETLVLEESTATITIANNNLQSLSGTVNLSLDDGGGAYLNFQSAGDFDCLNTKSFSGEVSASVCREKQLGGSIPTDRGAFTIHLAEGGGFSTTIVDNKISEASGSIGVSTKLDGNPFFTGVVEGSYKAASPDTGQTEISGTGTITLDSDLEFPAGGGAKFALGEGSSGSATIVNNEITAFSGSINIKIAEPGKALGEGNELIVSATGDVDVQHALIKSFTGSASITGAFKIANDLSLTSLAANVTIIDNEIQEISGNASVEFKKENFTITGACDTFRWIKGGAEPDKFEFVGSLDVTAFDDKLHGKATVSYNTMSDPNAAPTVDGELEFKITEWLSGKVGIRFENGGWDDPVIWGSIDVVNAELIPGRQLMSFSKDLGVNIPVYTGVNVEAGIGFGASIDMQPVLINGNINIDEFHIKNAQGLPDFEMEISATTGLDLKASIAPYIGVNIGIANVLSAGLRVRGKAELAASAEASVGGKLTGGKDGFGGEVSLGFGVSANANVAIIPEVYAGLFGKELKYELANWNYDLGEIFSFDWSKTFKFGDQGTSTEDGGGEISTISGSTTQVDSEVVKGESEAEYAPEGATGGEKDKPVLPGSDEVGQDSMGEKTGDSADSVGGIGETIEQVKQIAEAVGAIGKAVGMISQLVTGFASGGFVGLAIMVLKLIFVDKSLTIDSLTQMFTDIIEGVQALKALIASAGDMLADLLPDWLVKLIDFFKGETIESLSNKVITILEQKIAEMANPIPRILAPVIDFLRGQTQKLVEILTLLTSGDVGSIIKGVLKILGFSLSSITDLIKMGGDMFRIMGEIIRECISSHTIWVNNKNQYQVKIYDLINFSGKDWFVKNGLLLALGSFGLKEEKAK